MGLYWREPKPTPILVRSAIYGPSRPIRVPNRSSANLRPTPSEGYCDVNLNLAR
jgi:hypothetical protein